MGKKNITEFACPQQAGIEKKSDPILKDIRGLGDQDLEIRGLGNLEKNIPNIP